MAQNKVLTHIFDYVLCEKHYKYKKYFDIYPLITTFFKNTLI